MKDEIKHRILTIIIAFVWFANGLICKVLNLVPRHEQIVSRILGNDYSRLLTILIGVSEVVMAVWIFTRYKSKFNAITQITIVVLMNIIEFLLVPDLLLWGQMNSLLAFLFIVIIYYNEFVLNKNLKTLNTA